jgi:hypothetical protein
MFAASNLARLLEARFECAHMLQISRLRWRCLQHRTLYTLESRCKLFVQRQNMTRLLEMLLAQLISSYFFAGYPSHA